MGIESDNRKGHESGTKQPITFSRDKSHIPRRSDFDIYYYGDHDRRYPELSFGLLNRFIFRLKRWGRTNRLNCPACGVFMGSPVWNEDLHRFEWYCLGVRLGCLEAIGDYPLVLHSGFEVVEELSDEDKKRLCAMIEEVQLPYPMELLRRLRGIS